MNPGNMYEGIRESGFNETKSMPCSIKHLARSRWSEGPRPQMPTFFPFAITTLIKIAKSFMAAGRGEHEVYCCTGSRNEIFFMPAGWSFLERTLNADVVGVRSQIISKGCMPQLEALNKNFLAEGKANEILQHVVDALVLA